MSQVFTRWAVPEESENDKPTRDVMPRGAVQLNADGVPTDAPADGRSAVPSNVQFVAHAAAASPTVCSPKGCSKPTCKRRAAAVIPEAVDVESLMRAHAGSSSGVPSVIVEKQTLEIVDQTAIEPVVSEPVGTRGGQAVTAAFDKELTDESTVCLPADLIEECFSAPVHVIRTLLELARDVPAFQPVVVQLLKTGSALIETNRNHAVFEAINRLAHSPLVMGAEGIVFMECHAPAVHRAVYLAIRGEGDLINGLDYVHL